MTRINDSTNVYEWLLVYEGSLSSLNYILPTSVNYLLEPISIDSSNLSLYFPAACTSQSLSPILPIPNALPLTLYFSSPGPSVFYVGKTRNCSSTTMNGHWSSIKSPESLPIPFVIHNNSLQLSFNACWKVLGFRTYCLMSIKPLAAIMNWPTN